MQKIWSETVPKAKLWSETYFLTKRSETFEAKWSEIFFPEFRKKEAKPSETVCVSLSSETFLEAKLGHRLSWQMFLVMLYFKKYRPVLKF